MKTPISRMTIDQYEILIHKAIAENDRLKAVNAELVKALEIAEATIQRLQRHAPGTANGTLDVMRAALAKAKEKS